MSEHLKQLTKLAYVLHVVKRETETVPMDSQAKRALQHVMLPITAEIARCQEEWGKAKWN